MRFVLLLFVTFALGGCTQAGDAPAPTAVAPLIDSAREALDREDDAGRDFRFRAARCRADGNVLLLFEQYGRFSEGLAITMSGRTSDGVLGWALGFAPIDPETDPEIAAFFASAPEVPCS